MTKPESPNSLCRQEIAQLETLCREHREMIVNMTADAGCGHTGGSMSAVEIVVALYNRVMRIDPARPDWPERDRFILSKGHATPIYYAALAKRGYFPLEWLAQYDRVGSPLQGHPCMLKTPGVDMSTGSLGQGLSVGIGMALGREGLGQDFHIHVLLGDGECQEGQVWEAAMYAGRRRTRRLIAIVDYNRVQLTGTVPDVLDLSPLADKWRAFGWRTVRCDGHDVGQVALTLEEARSLSVDGPVVVLAHTVKGKGVSFMEGKFEWHGKACDEDERARALAEIRDGDR